VHGYHLMREQERILDKAEIAADWYDRVYAPAVGAVERDHLAREYREAPEADLFLMLHQRRRDAFPSCGCPPLEETLATVVAESTKKRRIRLFRG
jgi:hypothetical protein